MPEEIYLFQGDKYIDTCEKVETYNRVMAEQTEEDVVKYIEQQKKIAKFGKYVREHAIEEVGVMKKTPLDGGTAEHSVELRHREPCGEPHVTVAWEPDPIGDI